MEAMNIKILLATLVLSISLAACEPSGTLENGFAAYKRGDYTTALRLWRSLAQQGNASAQYNLGLMYEKGYGLPQDDILAHMWFSIAAAKGNKTAVKERDFLAMRMTPAQVAEAEKLAWEWWVKHPKK